MGKIVVFLFDGITDYEITFATNCLEKRINMDITFNTEQGRFNYRVCAIIINEGKLLAMHNETTPYFYLPGGRVKFNETVEEEYLYPTFIKERINNLPKNFEILVERE